MAAKVLVEAGSRLHAGFYMVDHVRGLWGSAGFYVREPRVLVEAWRCSEQLIEAPPGYGDLLRKVLDYLSPGGACLRLGEAPPRHVGLGSTTQVALAAAAALSSLKGEEFDPLRAARSLGRGRVSGVGTLLFARGGFAADAGVPDPRGPRPLVRLDIPEDWRFIVLIPKAPRGPSEAEEEARRLLELRDPGPSGNMMARGFVKLASGVARGDLETALEGLREMQLGTGMYFSRLQGGVFRSDVARIVDEASRNGVVLAQSSWGPTLYTITSAEEAGGDARLLKSICMEAGLECRVMVAEPRNEGYKLKKTE